MGTYLEHLNREWAAMGWPTSGDDDPQVWIYNHLKKLLEVFDGEGHSGSSAPYMVELFRKLALFKPIGPLTGNDSEWMEVSDGVFQNLRASHVFRENGEAYDIEGKVFEEPNGSRFTSRDSRVVVTFPYTPVTEIVKVDKEK
jgi:hypothetical protein